MEKTVTMTREELIAAMTAMQAQMNEMSKTLTYFKNEIKEKKKAKAVAKTAATKEKKAKPVKHVALLNDDLEVIALEIESLRNTHGTFWTEVVYSGVKKMWAEYAAAHKANLSYDLSQLWVRIKKLGITGTFQSYVDFRKYMGVEGGYALSFAAA